MQSTRLGTSLLAALAISLLAGCPSSTTTPPGDAGTVDFVGRACNVDAECGGLRCDGIRRQCICLSDDSCKSANPEEPVRYCNNYTGLCVAEVTGCTQDTDCKDGLGRVDPTMFCDASTRSCRPRKTFCEPCQSDKECGGAEDNCLLEATLNQRFCSKACATNADCARGAKCETREGKLQCWPAPNPLQPTQTVTCKDFRGCTPDSLKSCATNADCADLGGQRCDPAQGKCVAIQQVCGFGTVCDPRNRICVAECTADADCGDPKLRCNNRVCEPLGECTEDNQCPANKVCSVPPGQTAGQCMPFCQGNADCSLGQVCEKSQADGRYRCVSGCKSHLDCAVNQRCNATTQQCEGPVVGGQRVCQAAAACNGCEECVGNVCQSAKVAYSAYCGQCTSSSDCSFPLGDCVLMDDNLSYCVKLCGTGPAECPQGFVCLPVGDGTKSACVPSNRQCQNKCS